MEKTLLAKRKKSQLSVDQTGQMFIDDKAASIAAAVDFYSQGERLLAFPTATKTQSIEQSVEAQREKIDTEIAMVESVIGEKNQEYYKARDAWDAERLRIAELKKQVAEFERRRPPMGSTYTDEQKLAELKTERAKIDEALGEAAALRGQQRISPDELAAIASEQALLARVRKAM